MPFRLLKYPPYECVYKSLHNVINRRLKEVNKQTMERLVAAGQRSAFELEVDE